MSKQPALFEEFCLDWKKHWVGMPEYELENLQSWKSVIVHFECEDDLDAFAELMEQKVYTTTKSLWYPKADSVTMKYRRYCDES